MGLEDVSKYPALFAALLGTGTWSLDDLKKVAGLNFLRVFREVEKVGPFFVKSLPRSTSKFKSLKARLNDSTNDAPQHPEHSLRRG